MQNILKHTTDTKAMLMDSGAVSAVGDLFCELFPGRTAFLVADTNTYRAAGERVEESLRDSGVRIEGSVIFPSPEPHAKWGFVEKLEDLLKGNDAVPVAVGSGVINDLTKLAAYRTDRKYICVGTAASMDGYAAYGSSITLDGSKQAFDCPAPYGIVIDTEVVAAAPVEMSASGYADLIAKIPAGADWILADAVGAEPIDTLSFGMIQSGLREALDSPCKIPEGSQQQVGKLTEGLLLGGFAMQAYQSSRPASGGEHQFSHLWDMEGHTYRGSHVSHGFQVGIGTLASTAFHELLLKSPVGDLDIDKCVAAWPDEETLRQRVIRVFDNNPSFTGRCLSETMAKYVTAGETELRLERLKNNWPETLHRLKEQLVPFDEIKRCLREVGAPYEPEQIGISRQRLYESFLKVPYMRSRINIFDIAIICGYFGQWMEELFGPGGIWCLPARGDNRSTDLLRGA